MLLFVTTEVLLHVNVNTCFIHSWISNRVVSCHSRLVAFACTTYLIMEREQGLTLAAVLCLSALIVSHCLASDSVVKASHSDQWKPHVSRCSQSAVGLTFTLLLLNLTSLTKTLYWFREAKWQSYHKLSLLSEIWISYCDKLKMASVQLFHRPSRKKPFKGLSAVVWEDVKQPAGNKVKISWF